MSNPQPQKQDEQKPFNPEPPKIDMVRRFRLRWIIDIVFALIMFALAAVNVANNPTMLYFYMSAFWFILAGWDRHRLNQALKAQPGK